MSQRDQESDHARFVRAPVRARAVNAFSEPSTLLVNVLGQATQPPPSIPSGHLRETQQLHTGTVRMRVDGAIVSLLPQPTMEKERGVHQ